MGTIKSLGIIICIIGVGALLLQGTDAAYQTIRLRNAVDNAALAAAYASLGFTSGNPCDEADNALHMNVADAYLMTCEVSGTGEDARIVAQINSLFGPIVGRSRAGWQ